MPRVLFLKDFDFKPTRQSTIVYKKGDVYLVRDDCAKRAIAAGAAELTDLPAPPSGLVDTILKEAKRKRKNGTSRTAGKAKPAAPVENVETEEPLRLVSYREESDF